MSREQCPKCKHVFSTTASPNDNEGYWLTDVAIDRLEFDMTNENLVLLEWLDNNAHQAIRCPQCKEISIVED